MASSDRSASGVKWWICNSQHHDLIKFNPRYPLVPQFRWWVASLAESVM